MPAPSKITDAEWQKHEATIRRLYIVENRTLDFVMREMSSTHGFSASKYQYTTRLSKWGMKKNAEHETWSSISGALKRRCMDISDANVFLNDQLVPRKKLKKELQRYTAQEDALTVTTPEGITIQPILEHIRKQQCVIPGSLSISLPWHALIDTWSMNWSFANASPATLSAQSSVQIDSSDWTWPSPESYNATFSYGMSSYARGGNSEPPILVDIGNPDLLGREADEIVRCFGLGTLRFDRNRETTLQQHLRAFVIDKQPDETQRAVKVLMGPYSIASMKVLTAYMTLMLSNDLGSDDGVLAFLAKADELHFLGNLTPIFSQGLPSARAIATRILHAAVRMNNTKFLRQAMKHGADVESPSTGKQSSTLLQEALRRGRNEAARVLIDARANANVGSSTTYGEKGCKRKRQHVKGIVCYCEREASDCTVALAARTEACVSLIPELLRKGASISNRDPILIAAIEAGASTECITYLINAGADINLCSTPQSQARTPLSVAAQRGNLEVVQALLKAGANANGPLQSKLLLACADASFLHKAWSPLLWAFGGMGISAQDCFNVVRLLLQYGADPNISAWEVLERKPSAGFPPDHHQGYWYYSEDLRISYPISYPLQAAVCSGNMELVILLLQHKASTNSSYGTPALALAILLSNAEMVYLLLEHGADPNGLSKQPYCQSALEAAVDKKDLEALDLLLQFGGDINNDPAPYGGRTPLQRAAENGDERMIAYLLEHGASILSQSAPFRGFPVLQGFVCNGLHTYISKAIKAGACLNPAPSRYATSPLAAAVIQNDAVSVKLLLDAGANIQQYSCADYKGKHRRNLQGNYSPWSQLSPIQWAAVMNHIEIARMLCEAGADVNQTPHIPDGGTALHIAIECENYEIAKFLVEQNADVGAYSHGKTALHAAIETCNVSFLDLLLGNGADPNQSSTEKESDSLTPLDKACEYGELTIVRSLLCARADTSQGYAVQTFTEASYESDFTLEILEMLLQYGADVNKRCLSRNTALQEAILLKNFPYVDRLIEAGAYINAPPSNVWTPSNYRGGRTALEAAVEIGRVDMVERLLALGADVNAPAAPDHGVTALQAAAIKGYLNIAKILLEHGAIIDAAASPKNGRTAINGAAEFGRIDMVKLLLDNYHGPSPISELLDDAYRAAEEGNQWYVMQLLDAYEHPDEVSP